MAQTPYSESLSDNATVRLSDDSTRVESLPFEEPPPKKEQPKSAEEQKKAEAEKKKAAEALAKKVGSAHKPLFFDNDFSYLCDPNYNSWLVGDGLKKRCLPGGGWFDVGGEYRMRAHFEQNMRGLGLTGVDDQFLLHRTRIYGDFHLSKNLRLFGEMIDAESNNENFASRPIEVNRTDLLNLFVDATLLDSANRKLLARVGRQELLYGAQRAISPLDWANTRRNFEGAKLTWSTEKWALDGFWTNPIRVDDHAFDSPDHDQEFMGLYSSYKPAEKQAFDVYALRYLNSRGANNFKFNTLGMRSQGELDGRLWDFEGGYQFGENSDGSDHSAGMVTAGLGKKITELPWQPTLWCYYDWASGGNSLGGGKGYNHMFPLAHKYNGFMDLFGRSNIQDANVSLALQPTKKVKLLTWYHYFALANAADTPYSVVMTPFNGANVPGSSDLGHELDLIADIALGKRQSLLLGYSHFFAGDYYATTPGVPFNGGADFYYTQWSVSY